MTRNIHYYIIALCITCMIQVFGISRLTLFNVSPDAVTIFLVFISLTIGQRAGMSFGFAAGMLVGIFSGNMGLNMLARTVEGFLAGFFHIPETSHATTRQKTKLLYGAILIAGFTGNAILASGNNPLGLHPVYRIVVLGLLQSLFTMLLAAVLNRLVLKKSFLD